MPDAKKSVSYWIEVIFLQLRIVCLWFVHMHKATDDFSITNSFFVSCESRVNHKLNKLDILLRSSYLENSIVFMLFLHAQTC
jgi:hypothetical protein